jgi:hypothetical protein
MKAVLIFLYLCNKIFNLFYFINCLLLTYILHEHFTNHFQCYKVSLITTYVQIHRCKVFLNSFGYAFRLQQVVATVYILLLDSLHLMDLATYSCIV